MKYYVVREASEVTKGSKAMWEVLSRGLDTIEEAETWAGYQRVTLKRVPGDIFIIARLEASSSA